MCEQQFDFVCAHIARLKQTETDRQTERKKEMRRLFLWHSLLSCFERCSFAHSTHLLLKQTNLNWAMNYFLKRFKRYVHTHTHTQKTCTYTLSIYTKGLCRSVLEMQLFPLSGQISNSNLTIDLYILSVINHRLRSLNKSNNTHTHTHK